MRPLAAGCVTLWAGAALAPPAPEEPAVWAEPDAPPAEEEGIREVVVVLTTGREIAGALVNESREAVVVRINGIDTTIPRGRVAGVRRLAPVAERYAELRAAVDDNDVRARLALAEWLRAREAYRLALAELKGVLEIDPANQDARTLHDWLTAHLELAAKARERRPTRSRATPPAPPIPTLTPEQINLIRIYEIDLSNPGRLVVPDELLRELMVRHPESFPAEVAAREAIIASSPAEKLRVLFDHKARDLYPRVRVLDDPPVMTEFKRHVHAGWVVNACASNRCHGGEAAGRLRLLNQRPNSDTTAYTNFIILDRFRLADGTPLINHEQPARSPLLQMGLPRQVSLYPHPEVDRAALGQDWRFVFRNSSAAPFKRTVEWIVSLYRPRTDYGIAYPPAASEPGDAALTEDAPPSGAPPAEPAPTFGDLAEPTPDPDPAAGAGPP